MGRSGKMGVGDGESALAAPRPRREEYRREPPRRPFESLKEDVGMSTLPAVCPRSNREKRAFSQYSSTARSLPDTSAI